MRIALLAHLHHPISDPFLGGTEMHTAVVANELVRRGHDVTLFAKEGTRTAARLAPVLGAGFVFGAHPGPGGADRSEEHLAEVVHGVIGTIRHGDYDVVLNNSFGHLPFFAMADLPMLTVLHTPPTLERVNEIITAPGWQPGRRHVFVSVSEHNTASWRSVLPEVGCVPNGVYLDRWRDRGSSEQDLAVWAARVTAEKGLHLAIEAARTAGMRLEFSGPISDRAYFETRIRPLLDEDVVHRGHIDHHALPAQLARGAVFISSSVWAEPFGLALVEAMACGTPVAAFPSGAAAEVVGTDGGMVARDCTPDALAEAVKLARDADRDRVRRSAQRFDARAMVGAYEQILVRLAG
ncbi:MAG: glycosyltransferase [Friedmanniella sp.]|nr:glycosyltransferase [Friedmanniella sp.]